MKIKFIFGCSVDKIMYSSCFSSVFRIKKKSVNDQAVCSSSFNSQVATVPEAVERYTNPIAIGYTNFRIL